ncbi:MAG: VanZ family protein [Myxococcales bacterium]|nr:VanZ family protein [Myxococcales bacterium]
MRFAPAALWAGCIWFLSSFDWRKMPWRSADDSAWLDALPAWIPVDKIVHALIFGLLAVLITRPSLLRPRRAWLTAVGLCALWGGIDEWHQSWIPGRDSDGMDVAADVTGAAVGAWQVTRSRLSSKLRR